MSITEKLTTPAKTITEAIAGRRGDWVQTFTGRAYWPLDPCTDDVSLEDIAHALSMICRFNGHCPRFYSVAEHSVRCWRVARMECPEHAAWALLHDAAEAYLCDLPRPVKRCLPEYKTVERLNEKIIAARFGLRTLDMPAAVKEIDSRMLTTEATEMGMLATAPHPWASMPEPYLIADVRMFMGWTPARAEVEFLSAAGVSGLFSGALA
jgi:hypothetical protein